MKDSQLRSEEKPPIALLSRTTGKSHDKSIAGAILPPEALVDCVSAGIKAATTSNIYQEMARLARSSSFFLLSPSTLAVFQSISSDTSSGIRDETVDSMLQGTRSSSATARIIMELFIRRSWPGLGFLGYCLRIDEKQRYQSPSFTRSDHVEWIGSPRRCNAKKTSSSQ